MKTTVYADVPGLSPVAYVPGTPARARWLDFLELTKPRISVMVLFTVAIGALLAPTAGLDGIQLLHALLGTALTAAGASALNQWLERRTDGAMRRTENRPLPAGRLTGAEVLVFGTFLSALGLGYMFFLMAHALPAGIAALTHLSYVCVYTPLKRKTTLNTLIGAVPGALPPVIGWTAMTGSLDVNAGILFLIVFFWQVPHFLAIAWMYREDYAHAGLKMLPGVDPEGTTTARQMLIYTLALVGISVTPLFLADASPMFGFGALGLGAFFLRFVWAFALQPGDLAARRVMQASLIYLPGILGLFLLERWLWLMIR